MTPKQLHIFCDILLLIPILGILISIFYFSNKLDKEVFIIKDIFNAWKKKPIHILQDSYQKTCEDMGMNDIIHYEWPGTLSGCVCNNHININKCSERELQLNCKTIEEIKPYRARKWKTRYLCSSSINSKSYFELNKVKASDNCPYKYKKCGVIDTLNNHLCIMENDNCPLNSITFLNTVDEQHVRIDTSNSNSENGKIYSNFIVAQDKLCVNHIEREFSEKNFKLIQNNKYLEGCTTILYDKNESFNQDKTFDRLDQYKKKLFYEHNNIFPFVYKNVKDYPNDFESDISVYAGMFTGWKRECDRKEFNQFKNGDFDSEISEIINTTEDYNSLFIIYSILVLFTFSLGVIVIKYSRILNQNGNKIEISNSTLVLIILIYSCLILLFILLFYSANVNSDSIRAAKFSNDFFEMLTSHDCSDDFTNSLLKNLTREYFLYANRYFNIKLLSSFSILISLFVICISSFGRSNDPRLRRRNFYKSD